MKFLAALFAKLTGTAEAPKTLDQARATFGEAKAALDRITALFTTAALDLDDLLAKGDSALKDLLVALNTKVTDAQAVATQAEGKVSAAAARATEAEGKISALNSQLAAFGVLFASIGFKPSEVKGKDGAAATTEEVTVAFQSAWTAHVAAATTQKMAELGVRIEKLPAASQADAAETEADLLDQLGKATTAQQRGAIGAKLNALRNARWGATGRN